MKTKKELMNLLKESLSSSEKMTLWLKAYIEYIENNSINDTKQEVSDILLTQYTVDDYFNGEG